MKTQRTIYEAEQATSHFSSKPFTFINTKFRDLSVDIPSEERDDFFIYPKLFQQNRKIIIATYLVMLKELFGQKIPRDNEKAKKRYKKVVLISRIYQILAYWFLSYFAFNFICSFLV